MTTAIKAVKMAAEAINKKNKRTEELMPIVANRIIATIDERIVYSAMNGDAHTHYKVSSNESLDYQAELLSIQRVLEYYRNNGYSAEVEYSELGNGDAPSFTISINWLG